MNKIKRTMLVLGTLLLLVLIYTLVPQIPNPSPAYGTKLSYGNPLPENIQKVLTPAEKPKPVRSIVILEDEKIVYEYGPTDKIMNVHSMRKAFMSLLYGIAIEKGLIDINKTLIELGIDENPALTDQEKSASIRDLLMYRSGIYLPGKGEHDAQITHRPKRESYKPGEYFFANNFDANALGTIFILETGYEIGAFMEEFIAKPLGMQDFTGKNVIMGAPWFWPESESLHDMYYIHLSTRDSARIGAMVANNGKWGDVQVVPAAWIEESTAPLSDLKDNHIRYGFYDACGYIWKIDQDTNTIWTDGYGGHYMLIDPERKIMMVERNFTGNSHLSTGLFLMNKPHDAGPGSLRKAHKMMVNKS